MPDGLPRGWRCTPRDAEPSMFCDCALPARSDPLNAAAVPRKMSRLETIFIPSHKG